MRSWGLLLAAFCLLATPAWAQAPAWAQTPDSALPTNTSGNRPPGPQMRVPSAKREQIQAIHARYEEQLDQLSLQVEQGRLELADMLRNHANPNQTESKLNRIVSLEGQRQNLMLQEYYEICKILTPQERKKFTWYIIRQLTHERSGMPNGNGTRPGQNPNFNPNRNND